MDNGIFKEGLCQLCDGMASQWLISIIGYVSDVAVVLAMRVHILPTYFDFMACDGVQWKASQWLVVLGRWLWRDNFMTPRGPAAVALARGWEPMHGAIRGSSNVRTKSPCPTSVNKTDPNMIINATTKLYFVVLL